MKLFLIRCKLIKGAQGDFQERPKIYFFLRICSEREEGGARNIKIDIKKAKTYKTCLTTQIIPTHTKGIHKI